jgi:opacity protein-like surface antigen
VPAGGLGFEIGLGALPVLFKLRLGPGSTPFLGAGARVGYVLNSKIKYKYDWAGGEMDFKDEVSRLQYGLVFSGGYQLALGSMAVSLEVRYQRGLSNMIKNPLSGESVRTSTWTVLAGYRF